MTKRNFPFYSIRKPWHGEFTWTQTVVVLAMGVVGFGLTMYLLAHGKPGALCVLAGMWLLKWFFLDKKPSDRRRETRDNLLRGISDLTEMFLRFEKDRHDDLDSERVREFLESREHALSVKDTDDFYDAAMAMERKFDHTLPAQAPSVRAGLAGDRATLLTVRLSL